MTKRKSARRTASTVVPTIRSKSDLEAHLRWFAAPMWTRAPNCTSARRYIVEEIRPALRAFCRRFRVEIPVWLSLSADERYRSLTMRERLITFGPDPLVIAEFAPRRREKR